jgi:tRNA G18 (ribose-2'-O)-methylase SpoU
VGEIFLRGYFGIGAEKISKPMNLGNLFRSAHAFGASFAFTVDAPLPLRQVASDTSNAFTNMPYYQWESIESLQLPRHCQVVGIELTPEAVDLPSFRHPSAAAYFLGPEKGSLSNQVLEICDHVIKIPTRFCINVATAGAIVMYDRLLNLGSFEERPVFPGGPTPPRDADGWRSPPKRQNASV